MPVPATAAPVSFWEGWGHTHFQPRFPCTAAVSFPRLTSHRLHAPPYPVPLCVPVPLHVLFPQCMLSFPLFPGTPGHLSASALCHDHHPLPALASPSPLCALLAPTHHCPLPTPASPSPLCALLAPIHHHSLPALASPSPLCALLGAASDGHFFLSTCFCIWTHSYRRLSSVPEVIDIWIMGFSREMRLVFCRGQGAINNKTFPAGQPSVGGLLSPGFRGNSRT